MMLNERPAWRVETYDPRSRSGLLHNGSQRVTFENPDEQDFVPGEAVFITLRDETHVKRLWPAVAHLKVSAAIHAPANSPAWAPRARAVLEALPYPLEAEVIEHGDTRILMAFSVSPNEYAPWGADVSIEGELQLRGIERTLGTLSGSFFAGRLATRLEHAALLETGPVSPDAAIIVLGEAGRFTPPPAPRSAQVCAVRELVWLTHEPSSCAHLEATLAQHWAHHGAPRTIAADAHGTVFATWPQGTERLGQVEPTTARRWATAFSSVC